jgi:hypothetical protein
MQDNPPAGYSLSQPSSSSAVAGRGENFDEAN